MISIQSSLTELERIHQVREGLLDCYLSAIKNCSAYAVEFDDEITIEHKKYLTALAEEVAHAELPQVFESRATLRNLLRDYRDKGARYLLNLRDELSSSARALEEILDSLSQSDGEHEARLRTTVTNLRTIAESPEGRALSGVLRNAASSIEQSVDQLRKQHQLTVSQFQMEIRMLHKRIDSLESAAASDDLARCFTRPDTEARIRATPPGEYCLLLITVRGLRRAEVQFGPEVASELAGAFVKRLRNCVPPNTPIARWAAEEMVVLLKAPKSDAVTSGKWITEHLSGSYACLQAGKTVRPTLQLNVGVVDTVTGESPEAILDRVTMFLTGA